MGRVATTVSMPRHSSAAIEYQRLRKAIKRELASGAERVRLAYRDEVVRTYWKVGRVLSSELGLGKKDGEFLNKLLGRDFGDFPVLPDDHGIAGTSAVFNDLANGLLQGLLGISC